VESASASSASAIGITCTIALRELDGFAIFEQGHGIEHVDALLNAFDHAGMEITKELAAQGGRSAALSGDLDVGATAGTFR
jgi:hypothetical protein